MERDQTGPGGAAQPQFPVPSGACGKDRFSVVRDFVGHGISQAMHENRRFEFFSPLQRRYDPVLSRNDSGD